MGLNLLWRPWAALSSSRSAPTDHQSPQPQPAPPGAAPVRGLNPAQLERLGLGVVARSVRTIAGRSGADSEVRRIYCLGCGMQVDDSEIDEAWWHCRQGCNEPASD